MPPPYPVWIWNRLKKHGNKPPRYENSYYGPINAVFSHLFPPIHGFLVKPQAIIRPHLDEVASTTLSPDEKPHPEATRRSERIDSFVKTNAVTQGHGHSHKSSVNSVDSWGDNVLARADMGWEANLDKPDFMLAKVTGDDIESDKALALIEIKTTTKDKITGMNRVNEYLDDLQTKDYADEFVAFLIMGEVTMVWKTVGTGNTRRQVRQPGLIETGGPVFCDLLSPLYNRYKIVQ